MPTRNLDLTDHFERFIETGVSSGRFSDASEAVREGLRLLEEREAEDRTRLEWLRSATQESFAALDRGEGITFRSVDELAAFIEETGEGLATEDRRG